MLIEGYFSEIDLELEDFYLNLAEDVQKIEKY